VEHGRAKSNSTIAIVVSPEDRICGRYVLAVGRDVSHVTTAAVE
jgi:hypothetical protein